MTRGSPRRVCLTAAVARYAPLLIAGVWLWAGLYKLLDVEAFVRVLKGHQVVPSQWITAAAWTLPFIEISVGLLLAAGADGRRLRRLSLAASAVLLLSATLYLALAPAWALEQYGCGCGVGNPLPALPKYGLILRNGVFLAFHLVVMVMTWNASAAPAVGWAGLHRAAGSPPAP